MNIKCINFLLYFFVKKYYNRLNYFIYVAGSDGMEVIMANFKKFLAFTAVTAAAVAGGIAVYKKVQESKCDSDDDFDDFDDDDFDDDFDDDYDDLEIENRSYTPITSDTEKADSEKADSEEETAEEKK